MAGTIGSTVWHQVLSGGRNEVKHTKGLQLLWPTSIQVLQWGSMVEFSKGATNETRHAPAPLAQSEGMDTAAACRLYRHQ
jgi:hypothetical protein